MYIIFLENDPYMRKAKTERLAVLSSYIADLHIEDCSSIDEANSILDKVGIENIGLVITDLHLEPDGLTFEESRDTRNGILSGWVWLKTYIWDKISKTQNNNIKFIIYSQYTDELRERIDTSDEDSEKQLFSKVRILSKNETVADPSYLNNLALEMLGVKL